MASLYDEAPCGFLMTTLDGVVRGANRTFLFWTGKDEQSVVGRNVRELLSPASRLFYDTHYVALLQAERVNGVAMELARLHAPALPVLVTSRAGHDAESSERYVHSTFFDASERRDSERALVSAKRRADALADIVHSSPNAILTADYDLRLRTWNTAAGTLLGKVAPLEAGTLLRCYLPEKSFGLLFSCIETEQHVVEHVLLASGTVCQMSAYPMTDGLAVYLFDVTQETKAQQSLKEAHDRFTLATMATSDGIWDWNCETGRVYLSGRAQAMVGDPSEAAEVPLNHVLRRVHFKDFSALRNIASTLSPLDGRFEMEWRLRHRDGSWRWVHSRGMAVHEQGRLLRIIGSLTDVTERKTEDPLTGLHTRLSVLDRLEWRLSTDHLFDLPCAVLFIDLDTFKKVNDGLGHAAGDTLLSEVAARLRSVLRDQPSALAARIGGDEFVILLEEVTGADEVCAIANELQRIIQEPIPIFGQQISISASIGIALNRVIRGTAEDLLRNADLAMYRAKAAGRSQSLVFNEEMHEAAHTRLTLETDLAQAVRDNKLLLFYQPKVRLKDGVVTGYEALGRWRHASHGMVSPELFIALAEESNLIREIGRWTIQEAMRQLSKWQSDGLVGLSTTISINLSPKQFQDTELIDVVVRNLNRYSLSPACVHFEVTEGVLIGDVETALSVLKRLKAIGVGLELDDFGKGYSSLSYLHRYPFDSLKIDRSFVSGLGQQEDADAIVQTIIGLAHTLNLQVVAEGIETTAQETLLRGLGCELGQGYLYSRPVAPEAIEQVCRHAQEKPETKKVSSEWRVFPRLNLGVV